MKPVVLVLAARDRPLAQRVAAALGDATIEQPPAAAAGIRQLFAQGRPLVGICAAGILVRALAPVLADKTSEPPVIAVAPDASCVVPILGGHRGANRLARRIAEAIGAVAAISNASDAAFGVALDEPPPGWRLTGSEHVKAFVSALLDGATVRLVDEAGLAGWLYGSALPLASEARHEIRVTAQPVTAGPTRLVYHPPVVALGVGCVRGAPAAEVEELALGALEQARLSPQAVACVVSVDLKADEPAIHALAGRLGVEARFLPADVLVRERHRLATPSAEVERAVGTPGVAEAAALVAAGEDGQLVLPKQKSRRATAAVALARRPIAVDGVGVPRGRLWLVGLGPGDPATRTAEATAALDAASDVVGYGGYLDLLGPPAQGRALFRFALGEEEKRCRFALDRAAQGRAVALVCSGDPGIYAMAAPLFELLAREGDRRPDWRRVAIEVIPGVSAMQAAAARAGAPLGHDFCAISLSDLLTPASVIERRLEVAAAGDFVVALYNPVSARRTTLLPRARDILLRHRPPHTPVVIARNLGRPGESVRVVRLDRLETEGIDMTTTLIVGAGASATLAEPDGRLRVWTPRGYRLS